MRSSTRCGGFTYLTALFIIAIMGAGLALLGEIWETAALREREAELLYVGNQYRLAIERYVKSGGGLYPRRLEDLIKDPRSVSPRRHLRQLYADPITGTKEWGIIKAPDGGILGVYSRSEDAPLKAANFKLRDKDLEKAKKYSDWKFFYAPAVQAQGQPSATAPPAAGPAVPTAAPPTAGPGGLAGTPPSAPLAPGPGTAPPGPNP